MPEVEPFGGVTMVSKWWLGCVLVCVRGVRATCGPATAHGAVGDGETLNDGALK